MCVGKISVEILQEICKFLKSKDITIILWDLNLVSFSWEWDERTTPLYSTAVLNAVSNSRSRLLEKVFCNSSESIILRSSRIVTPEDSYHPIVCAVRRTGVPPNPLNKVIKTKKILLKKTYFAAMSKWITQKVWPRESLQLQWKIVMTVPYVSVRNWSK